MFHCILKKYNAAHFDIFGVTPHIITSPETKLKNSNSIAHKIYFRTMWSWGERWSTHITTAIMKEVKSIYVREKKI